MRVFGNHITERVQNTCRAAKSLKRSMLVSACTTMTILVQNDNNPTPRRQVTIENLVQASKPTHTNAVCAHACEERRQTSGHPPRVLATTIHSPIHSPPAHRRTRARTRELGISCSRRQTGFPPCDLGYRTLPLPFHTCASRIPA